MLRAVLENLTGGIRPVSAAQSEQTSQTREAENVGAGLRDEGHVLHGKAERTQRGHVAVGQIQGVERVGLHRGIIAEGEGAKEISRPGRTADVEADIAVLGKSAGAAERDVTNREAGRHSGWACRSRRRWSPAHRW